MNETPIKEFHQNSMAFEEDLKAMLPYFTVNTTGAPVEDEECQSERYLCHAAVRFKSHLVGTIDCYITRNIQELRYTREYQAVRENKNNTVSVTLQPKKTLREAVDFIMKDQ